MMLLGYAYYKGVSVDKKQFMQRKYKDRILKIREI